MINMFRSHATIKLLPALAAVCLLFLAAGCNQDSIFDGISSETAPTQAKIKGSPSKMVKANIGNGDKLYITNGRLWEYDLSASGAKWDRRAGPGGFVADVASTAGALYALTINNTSTRVWKGVWNTTNTVIDWTQIAPFGDYDIIQNIFGAGDTLFATGAKGAGNAYDYAIHYCKQQDSKFALLEETGDAILTGAGVAGTDYYLATLGNGIYKVPLSGAFVAESMNKSYSYIPLSIAGFLQAKEPDPNTGEPGSIIGVSRGGHILRIDSTGVKDPGASLGGTSTGALALMANPAPQGNYDKLLLFGYKGPNSSYRHGYLEVQFNSATGDHETSSRVPGANQPSSIQDDSRKDQQYTSSLRRYPVTALWVLPSADPTKTPAEIFAATTNEGLYSYRYRSDGGWQWNHEE
jgi:hypothetical protein